MDPDILAKYLDPKTKLLNPLMREVEPAEGDFTCASFAIKEVDATNRRVTAVASTPDVDRYQEIIEAEAYRKWLPTFMSNPVCLAGHRHVGFDAAEPTVIGKWSNLQITKDGLVGTVEFASTPLAERYWQLYQGGYMQAFSVGVIVHRWEMREFELGNGVTKKIRVMTEVELIEISAVAVPANRAALVRAAGLLGAAADGGREAIGELKERDAAGFAETIAKALEPLITKQITKVLTDPDGPTDALIREAIDAYISRESCGHDRDDLAPGGGEPRRSGSPQGLDELKRGLKSVVG